MAAERIVIGFSKRSKYVTVKQFMDVDTLIAERLVQCCVHVVGADNDPVPMPFYAARLFPKSPPPL